MIEKGECVTIEGAEAKLRKLDLDSLRVFNTMDGLNEKKDEIKKMDKDALQKDKR
jgi:hypothetical protein